MVYLEQPALEGAWYVGVDFMHASRCCVKHLLESGRKRIGLCLADRVYRVTRDRVNGYEQALHEAGLPFEEGLIFTPQCGGIAQTLETQLADKVLDQLVIERKADALLAFNDYWGARLIQRLTDRGLRVPDDVAVIGFNNLAFGELLVPPLTTVDEQDETVGRHLVRMLTDRIEGHDVPESQRHVTVKPELIVRGSG